MIFERMASVTEVSRCQLMLSSSTVVLGDAKDSKTPQTASRLR
jgi:hypothetical protein